MEGEANIMSTSTNQNLDPAENAYQVSITKWAVIRLKVKGHVSILTQTEALKWEEAGKIGSRVCRQQNQGEKGA